MKLQMITENNKMLTDKYTITRNGKRLQLPPLTATEIDKRLRGIGCGIESASEKGYCFINVKDVQHG